MAATGAPSEGSEASRDRRGMVTGQDEYPAELRLKVCRGCPTNDDCTPFFRIIGETRT